MTDGQIARLDWAKSGAQLLVEELSSGEPTDAEPEIIPIVTMTAAGGAGEQVKATQAESSQRDGSWIATEASCRSHFGECAQGPIQSHGRITTAVVTLPHPGLEAKVTCVVQAGHGMVMVDGNRTKLRSAVQMLLIRSRHQDVDVVLRVESNIPIGIGAGSSSAEVCAGLRAVARALGLRLTDMDIAHFAFLGEGPTDALPMLGWGVTPVWASRRGELLEVIPKRIPQLACVGVVGGRGAVSTVAQAVGTTYDRDEVRAFAKIYRRVKNAIQRQAAHEFVRACGDSLDLNQHRCPTPRLDELRQIATEVGALGVLASHSGTAAVIAFDASSEGYKGGQQATLREVRSRGFSLAHCFNTP